MDISGIILAGGKSSRMGVNKALLHINGVPAIQRIKDVVQGLVSELLLATNEKDTYEFLGGRIVGDIVKAKGPLSGIHSGIHASATDRNLVVACDLPFLSRPVTAELIRIAANVNADAVVPIIKGKIHPLFAVYRSTILPEAERALENNRLKMLDLLRSLAVYEVTEKDFLRGGVEEALIQRAFFNMNCPEDYERAVAEEAKLTARKA